MRELSLHILDIAQNSIKANAKLIIIDVEVKVAEDLLIIRITDDGKGMSSEFLASVADPFTTTRTTRKVGMGIPLFKQQALASGGTFEINSKPGFGTVVEASFKISSIDRMPMGELEETMGILVMGSPEIDFILCYQIITEKGMDEYNFDTREIKAALSEDIPIDDYEVISFIKTEIKENIIATNGGLIL